MAAPSGGRTREDWAQIASALDLAGAFPAGATTPDAVPVFWWLTLPPLQACWELGISADEYPRVHRDLEQMADLIVNRVSQAGPGELDINLTVPRRKTARLREMHRGGTLTRIGSSRKR